jgi:hypothetical protein
LHTEYFLFIAGRQDDEGCGMSQVTLSADVSGSRGSRFVDNRAGKQ